MSLNPEYASAPKTEKRSMVINYAGAPGVVRTLEALGLKPPPQLGQLAAVGAKLEASQWTVSLDDVDMALNETRASLSDRFAFKQALVRFGLMSSRRD